MSELRVNTTSWAAQIAAQQVRTRRASTVDPASVAEARDTMRNLREALAKLEDTLPARPRAVTATTSTTTYTDVTTTTTTTTTTTVPGVTGSATSSSAIVLGAREERELRTAMKSDLRDVREDLVQKGASTRSLIEALRGHLSVAERKLGTIK